MSIRLYPRAAFAVRHAASTDETRYNLNGLHFRADGSVEATDGHILAIARPVLDDGAEYPTHPGLEPLSAGDAELEPFILPLDVADRVAKAIPKVRSHNMPILANAALDVGHANANGSVRFGVTDLEAPQVLEARKIEGEYPNTGQVIPEASGKPTFAMNVSLLERACKVARDFTEKRGSKCIPLRFHVATEGAALKALRIEVSDPDKGDLTLVLMPMCV